RKSLYVVTSPSRMKLPFLFHIPFNPCLKRVPCPNVAASIPNRNPSTAHSGFHPSFGSEKRRRLISCCCSGVAFQYASLSPSFHFFNRESIFRDSRIS